MADLDTGDASNIKIWWIKRSFLFSDNSAKKGFYHSSGMRYFPGLSEWDYTSIGSNL